MCVVVTVLVSHGFDNKVHAQNSKKQPNSNEISKFEGVTLVYVFDSDCEKNPTSSIRQIFKTLKEEFKEKIRSFEIDVSGRKLSKSKAIVKKLGYSEILTDAIEIAPVVLIYKSDEKIQKLIREITGRKRYELYRKFVLKAMKK